MRFLLLLLILLPLLLLEFGIRPRMPCPARCGRLGVVGWPWPAGRGRLAVAGGRWPAGCGRGRGRGRLAGNKKYCVQTIQIPSTSSNDPLAQQMFQIPCYIWGIEKDQTQSKIIQRHVGANVPSPGRKYGSQAFRLGVWYMSASTIIWQSTEHGNMTPSKRHITGTAVPTF